MYRVRKIFRLPIGHRLSKHTGLCQNLHGHNLKIEVQVSNTQLNENDMVIDFHLLKEYVNRVLDDWDHACFLHTDDVPHFQNTRYTSRIIEMEVDPTAEVLSKMLYKKLNLRLNLNVDFVRIWENDGGMAEYSE